MTDDTSPRAILGCKIHGRMHVWADLKRVFSLAFQTDWSNARVVSFRGRLLAKEPANQTVPDDTSPSALIGCKLHGKMNVLADSTRVFSMAYQTDWSNARVVSFSVRLVAK